MRHTFNKPIQWFRISQTSPSRTLVMNESTCISRYRVGFVSERLSSLNLLDRNGVEGEGVGIDTNLLEGSHRMYLKF
jgi:hypothetical protein